MSTVHPVDAHDASLEQMRAAAAGQVANTSLRTTAREIGMSAGGLKKLLNGTTPYAPTMRRLRSWYVRYIATTQPQLDLPTGAAAISLLVRDLADGPGRQAALDALSALARAYEQSGKATPEWVNQLRAQYASSIPLSARAQARSEPASLAESAAIVSR